MSCRDPAIEMKDIGPAPSTNPFGAKALDEILCVEARAYPMKHMPAYVFLAMDAVSRHAHHFKVATSASVDDYVDFLHEVFKKYRKFKGQQLALPLPSLHEQVFLDAFPHFGGVISDARAVADITEDFHQGFGRMMRGG